MRASGASHATAALTCTLAAGAGACCGTTSRAGPLGVLLPQAGLCSRSTRQARAERGPPPPRGGHTCVLCDHRHDTELFRAFLIFNCHHLSSTFSIVCFILGAIRLTRWPAAGAAGSGCGHPGGASHPRATAPQQRPPRTRASHREADWTSARSRQRAGQPRAACFR